MPAYPEEEPSVSLEEMEAQTIGNLLPDEEDFFAGVVGHKSRSNGGGDDLDDCDLFSSVGGLELDGDVFSSVSQRDGKRGSNVFVLGDPTRGEISSRILFVTNMDSIIEDYELRALFEVRIFTCISDYIILIHGTICCFLNAGDFRFPLIDMFTCLAIWRCPGSSYSWQEPWLYHGIVL